ncbi:MAG: carbamoyl-phosphate synthase large subunit [Myxococcales bacterium]|nr:carbamoyl-phosphate synthase large subunit [Myxococcales bacterium]
MPQRTDIKTILVIGSGPIVIGQACEFDYSGTQACKVLRSLGYRVVLINSNPATIMTDPDVADATYIEPLTVDVARQVIERERPEAILPTVGGQTGLNLALALHEAGVLAEFNVELIGANPAAIAVAEDRELFKAAMEEIGIGVPRAGVARSVQQAEEIAKMVGLPAVVRPSFTLGGAGGGIAYNLDELREIVAEGLDLSPNRQVLVEESVLGWKEFELEVIRDVADNCVIICSIENVDPMGVHTGDSITVAPAQTLTDAQYQDLRDMSIAIIRRVGVDTGGSNVQFAVHPGTGEVRVIEMNPRVSRSSALASKATGFPIAKIAAQLAVGLTLDEIPNDITRATPASFEPTVDYVIVKYPRWNFEKFPGAISQLGTSMKSVGEVMGIGRTFVEAMQKAVASLEGGFTDMSRLATEEVRMRLSTATPERMPALFEALRRGVTPEEVHATTHIDPWFVDRILAIVEAEREVTSLARAAGAHGGALSAERMRHYKGMGFTDVRLAALLSAGSGPAVRESEVRSARQQLGVVPTYKRVDTCAAEFESFTPYLYSTYEEEDEAGELQKERVIVLGNGPNRIGQGLEFDYCCCHAAYAVQEKGYAAVMVNCNPETVSTDYDTSDKLYFEPVTAEHVQGVVAREAAKGTILQFGGQTPLKLAHQVGTILGTSPDAIDLCEDRRRFNALMTRLGVRQPEGAMVDDREGAFAAAARLGFPLLVRPSYVLGGRGMKICFDSYDFKMALDEAIQVSDSHPLLIDRFLEGAVEYDVDALCDGVDVRIAGIMEHIEEAGVHSGDSTTVYPPIQLREDNRQEMTDIVSRIGREIRAVGLMNVQFAVQQHVVYVIEVNPRASRTVPYLAKATGVPLARFATRLALGERLADLPVPTWPSGTWGAGYSFIKSPVFPWRKFSGVDTVLGPEMRSTGEVMGIGRSFGVAYAKAMIAAGMTLPTEGGVFLSLRDADKPIGIEIARELHDMGFILFATHGTARALRAAGVPAEAVWKVREGRPDVVDRIKNGDIQLLINSPLGKKAQYDEAAMRLAGLRFGVACVTNLQAARVLPEALRALRAGGLGITRLQDLGSGPPALCRSVP